MPATDSLKATWRLLACIFAAGLAGVAIAADTPPCANCAVWNAPQKPFKLYGNSYFVGPHGLGSVLITSDQGHVLIDGALADSAPVIAAHIRELGFRVEDIKLILNSHVHHDHAGGIAELQKLSGAAVKATAPSAAVLKTGGISADDPQFGTLSPIAPVSNVTTIADGETVRVGALALTAHVTPGHTAGGTTWTWDACEGQRCLHMVYADSISAVSSPDYRFTAHPDMMKGFEQSFTTIAALPCDILVSTHPEVSDLWTRLAHRDAGDANGLVKTESCRQYAATARAGYESRIAKERAAP